MPNRFRRLLVLAAALALITMLAGPPVARADNAGQVHVSAGIVDLNPIILTMCDSDAAFGTNLDANGTPSNSGDGIGVIHGVPAQNQGAVYQWDPACSSQPGLLQVDAPRTWTGTVCASESTGSSSLSIAGGNLRYSPWAWTSFIGQQAESTVYGYATGTSYTASFPDCGAGTQDWTTWNCTAGFASGCGAAGLSNHNFYFYLKIDRDDTAGSFDSTTTWQVIS
jgi:hypothetical protein